MEQEQRLDLKHTQKLILTPALQQSLKILQLPIMELKEYVKEELEQNPLLELTEKEETEDLEKEEDSFNMEDWAEYLTKNDDRLEGEKKEDKNYENLLKNKNTLEENLLWQLKLSDISREEYETGEGIIGNINQDGYLTVSTLEIAEKLELDEEKVKKVLSLIQTFEPIGIGARDLRECLLIQMKNKNLQNTIAWEIISNLWDDFQKGRFEDIAQKLGVNLKEIYNATSEISKLEPKPGGEISEEVVKYIIPDVTVEKMGDGRYSIVINKEGIPNLRINRLYKKYMLKKDMLQEERNFIKEKFKSAINLIRAIHQRKKTLYKVTNAIIEKQKDFLERGIEYLKPLGLKEISKEVGMNESTISRVTADKYIQTQKGIFSFKYFFNVKLNKIEGEGISSTSVKDIVKNITEEDKDNVLTDSKIVKILFERGINISRRTVAKYREGLEILPVSKRKIFNKIKVAK